MKRAVSISIGSSKRDKSVDIEILGEKVRLERIGTDGDLEKAGRLYSEMDGQVDAFGVGGTVLGLMVDTHWFPMYSIQSMVRNVHKTPIVDGTGLKLTLEKRVAKVIEAHIGDRISPKRALVMTAVDRWGMARAFLDASYECVFGDFIYSLGIPIPVYKEATIKLLARALLPIVNRLPFRWIYPIGESQEYRAPKGEKYFQWASVISGDCHYIWRYMPEKLEGKVIVTNTTTVEDREFFKKAGVKYLLTTTPVLEGRSFGTNMMEAAIVAAMGRKEPVDYQQPGTYFDEMNRLVDELNMTPKIQELL